MVDSKGIYIQLEEIAKTSSKNEKIAMVKALAEACPEFVRVLEYAYNPFKTYGIRQIVGYAIEGVKLFDASTWQLLDDLISRTLTGDAGRAALQREINILEPSSKQLLIRIIRKDLKADFSESTCNKAVKGLIPDFPYMRCALPKDTDLAKWPWARGVFLQEKADGMFANVDHEIGGLVRITSRQGSAFPIEKFPQLEDSIRVATVAGHQHHGEIIVKRDGVVCERQDGNGVLNSILGGGSFGPGEVPVYQVWDQIPLASVVSKGKFNSPYSLRIGGLRQQLEGKPSESLELIPTYTVSSLKEAMTYYRKFLAKRKEGVVIKHPDAIWKDTTSKEQIKLKLEVDVDLLITAIVPGKVGGKNEGRPGSMTCTTSEGSLQTDVTVKNDAIRAAIEANPEDWIGRVVAVRANSVMFPSESNDVHSLFLPRMVEAQYRLDKTEADSLQRVLDQFESAINP